MITFTLNGKSFKTDVPEDTPLLWVIREEAGLTGTKETCGKGVCGNCTVHLNGKAVRSCMLNVSAVEDDKVTTIEAIAQTDLHPVQKAWIKHNVAQCGYCQSGQIMQAVATLESGSKTEDEILSQMNRVLCRCGTYNQIKTAVIEAAKDMGVLK